MDMFVKTRENALYTWEIAIIYSQYNSLCGNDLLTHGLNASLQGKKKVMQWFGRNVLF